MLTRSQADSLSRTTYGGGKQKRLPKMKREDGLPLPTNVAGEKGGRSAAAKRLQKREYYE